MANEERKPAASYAGHQVMGLVEITQTLNVGPIQGTGLGDINLAGGINIGTTGATAGQLKTAGDIIIADGEYLTWSDTNLYRSAAGILKTDGSLVVAGALDVTGVAYLRGNIALLNKAGTGWLTVATRNTAGAEAVYDLTNLGNVTLVDGNRLAWSDTNLYRSAANILNTDDSLTVALGLNVGSATGAGTGEVKASGGADIRKAGTTETLLADFVLATTGNTGAGYIGVGNDVYANRLKIGYNTGAGTGLAYGGILDAYLINNYPGGTYGALLFGTNNAVKATLSPAGKFGVGVAPAEVIHSSAKVRADTVFNVNNVDGVTGNRSPVTSLRWLHNTQTGASTLQYKNATDAVSGGITTSQGAESDWTDVPVVDYTP